MNFILKKVIFYNLIMNQNPIIAIEKWFIIYIITRTKYMFELQHIKIMHLNGSGLPCFTFYICFHLKIDCALRANMHPSRAYKIYWPEYKNNMQEIYTIYTLVVKIS